MIIKRKAIFLTVLVTVMLLITMIPMISFADDAESAADRGYTVIFHISGSDLVANRHRTMVRGGSSIKVSDLLHELDSTEEEITVKEIIFKDDTLFSVS